MDAFDQLAWVAANDVLNGEKTSPGQQDRAMLAAAELVLRLLSRSLPPPPPPPPESGAPAARLPAP